LSSLSGGVLNAESNSSEHDLFGRARAPDANSLQSAISSGEGIPKCYRSGFEQLIPKFRAELARRGARGIIGLGRRFRIADDNGDRQLGKAEFKKCVHECGFKSISTDDLNEFFAHLDRDGSGGVDFEEFLQALRGPMSARRKAMVGMAFDVLDKDGSGIVEPGDIMDIYDTSGHPDVIAGKRSPDDIMREFLETFDVGGEVDGKVTRQEFENYYHNISASIDNDDYFELMIRNAWHISGGEGWAANTSNRRVLVTQADGTETVEEVKDDLGLAADDETAIINRMKRHNRNFGLKSNISLFTGGNFGQGGEVKNRTRGRGVNNKSFSSQISFG
jgi:Ca2+-binding EF-hand superfamily protein